MHPLFEDIRFIDARRLSWEKDIWREPARLGRAIRNMEAIAQDETQPADSRAEAILLLRRMYAAGKRPPIEG